MDQAGQCRPYIAYSISMQEIRERQKLPKQYPVAIDVALVFGDHVTDFINNIV